LVLNILFHKFKQFLVLLDAKAMVSDEVSDHLRVVVSFEHHQVLNMVFWYHYFHLKQNWLWRHSIHMRWRFGVLAYQGRSILLELFSLNVCQLPCLSIWILAGTSRTSAGVGSISVASLARVCAQSIIFYRFLCCLS